jgi:hypothetical protein
LGWIYAWLKVSLVEGHGFLVSHGFLVLVEGKFGYGFLIVGFWDLEFCLVWVSHG